MTATLCESHCFLRWRVLTSGVILMKDVTCNTNIHFHNTNFSMYFSNLLFSLISSEHNRRHTLDNAYCQWHIHLAQVEMLTACLCLNKIQRIFSQSNCTQCTVHWSIWVTDLQYRSVIRYVCQVSAELHAMQVMFRSHPRLYPMPC